MKGEIKMKRLKKEECVTTETLNRKELDNEILRAIKKMEDLEPNSEDYLETSKSLEQLIKTKSYPFKVSLLFTSF